MATNDLSYALRSLRRTPGFTTLTVITLALGIGANSVVNAVLLKPLPYPAPERLVFITSWFPGLGFDQSWVSRPESVEFREWNRSFRSVAAYVIGAVNLGTDQPSRPVTASVTHDLLDTLGVPPLAGRGFTEADTRPGAARVALLSYELWQRAYGADPSVIGRTVDIGAQPTEIVGVLPRRFDVHDQRVELWLPFTLDPANPGPRGNHLLHLVGRLADGVTLDQARAELDAMLVRWRELRPDTHVPSETNHRLRFDPLKEDIVGGVAPRCGCSRARSCSCC